jgi:hypothetical protein
MPRYSPFTVPTILLFILSIGLTACKSDPLQLQISQTPIEKQNPAIDMNTKIVLGIPLDFNTHKPLEFSVRDRIDLYIENQSENYIQFPPDNNLHFYAYNADNDSWVELENLTTTYFPDTPRILYPKSHDKYRPMRTSFHPYISNTTDPITIRVVVFGEISQDGTLTGEQFGAYMDLQLQP